MGEKKSKEELIADLEKSKEKIREYLAETSESAEEKEENPGKFEAVVLNSMLAQSETLGGILERTESLGSMSKCIYIITAEVSFLIAIAISFLFKI